MPWHAGVSPDHPIIETMYAGNLTPDELSDAVMETLSLIRAHDVMLLLADCTTLEGGHSISDLYGLADAVLKTGLAHRIKEAVLLPEIPDTEERVRFWETTCFNRGITVRIFDDRQKALDWLLGS
jgi:hypothetical protein